MKKKYTTFFIAILFGCIMMAQEAQKNFINYQGVVRNANNELVVSEAINLGVAVRFGSSNATITYEETHNLTTDSNGVFSLKIGNGNTISGDYDNLLWGNGAAYVTVSMNGNAIGTTELMAVPYAISSGDADDQTAAEVDYDNSISNLSATTAQAAIDELVGSGTIDADPDPTNELQTISFDTNTNELSLSDGNSITIPSGGTDADADPTNEFQNLSFDTNTNELSLSDGNTITIPSGGTDADADPTNELQDISLSGTNLSISDGSTIDLAPIVPPGGTDDQNLEINGDVLSIENGNGSVDLSTYRNDNDADPANEFQTLNFDGATNELSLSDGNTVTLPNGGGGGTDDQNLEINGDVLSIENGNGAVDLSTYRDDNDADPTNEIDVTTQNGLLIGDGNVVTGLQGTTNGQVPKWDSTNNEWVAGTDATGGGGSSLWTQTPLVNNLYYTQGRVGIGSNVAPSAELEVFSNSNSNKPQLALTESEDEFARLAFQNAVHDGAAWHIAGTARNGGLGSGNVFSGLNFFFKNDQGAENIMTIKGDGHVGIRNTNPQATLDVNGSLNMSGDFVNQAVYQVYPLSNAIWNPPASASGNEVDFPGATLSINVPIGSKVFILFNTVGAIDSDNIRLKIYRDNIVIYDNFRDCYDIAGARKTWNFNINQLDVDVTPGLHNYKVKIIHSDDAEDCVWYRGFSSINAIVIKE